MDTLRAPLNNAEFAKRHASGLSERQAQLLRCWGYPYVDDEFRFHMTLSDSLFKADASLAETMHEGAERHFAAALSTETLTVDALSIFRQEETGAPFSLLHRIPFTFSRRI